MLTLTQTFSLAVLVPLTRSVHKPATRVLSLQLEIKELKNRETTRRIITVLQPTHRSAPTVRLT